MTEFNEILLSPELEEMLRMQYPPESQAFVRELLLSYAADYAGSELDRIQFDVLHLGKGDPVAASELVQLARLDPRDIMTQEYFWVEGVSYPQEWARRHAINRERPEPPPVKAKSLAIGELYFRPTAQKKAQLLPSLTLTFSDWVSLLSFAGKLETILHHGGLLDLTSSLVFQGGATPQRTILFCTATKKPETLTYDGRDLSWGGSGDYWKECAFRCLELKKSETGSQSLIWKAGAAQQIRVQLRTGGEAPSFVE